MIVVKNPSITTKGHHKESNKIINRDDFGYMSWYIVTGGTYTANGALIMYYIDMMNIKGTFQIRWYSSFVAAPVLLGFFIFWEDFELFSSSCDGRLRSYGSGPRARLLLVPSFASPTLL